MAVFPEFRQRQCVRYRYRYSACDRCSEACPHDAIALTEEGATLDGTKCQNCGLCSVACRTEALQASNLPKAGMAALAPDKLCFSFACSPSGACGDSVVPCLGALSPAMLSSIVRQGVVVELRGTGHCSACQHAAKGADLLALNLQGLEILREAAGDETWAGVKMPDAEGQDAIAARDARIAARRQMFRRLFGKGVEAIASPNAETLPAPLRAIRAAAPMRSERRELLQTLWPHAADRPFSIPMHGSLPLAQLHLADGCTLCEACSRACPTGALQVEEDSSAWQLYFKAARCVGCGVCTEVCQPGVIRQKDAVNSQVLPENTLVLMHRMARRRCTQCDRFFVTAGGEDVCPVCQADDDDFTAIFG